MSTVYHKRLPTFNMKEVGGVSGFGGPFGGLKGGNTGSVYMTDNMDGATKYRSNVWNDWRS